MPFQPPYDPVLLYKKHTGTLQYTKNASASAKVDALNATMDSKVDSTNALVKLSVENNKSFPIPPTGVMGTFVITLAGFAMMAVGLTYGKGKKKKEEA